jgi:hypothetical protein
MRESENVHVNLSERFVQQFQEMELALERLRNDKGHPQVAAPGAPPEAISDLQQQLQETERVAAQWQELYQTQKQRTTELEDARRRLQNEIEQTRAAGAKTSDTGKLENELVEARRQLEELRAVRQREAPIAPPLPQEPPLPQQNGAANQELEQLRGLMAQLPEKWRKNPDVLQAQLVRLKELEAEYPDLKNEIIDLRRQVHILKNAKRV